MRCFACVEMLDTSCDFGSKKDCVIALLKWHCDHASTHPLLGCEKYLEHISTRLGCSAINNFKRGHFGGGVNKGVVIKFCLWNPLKPLLGLVTSKAS